MFEQKDQNDEVELRPVTAADQAFLLALYESTRTTELELTGWGPEQRQAFIQMQFNAQARGHQTSYPNAEGKIVRLNGEDIGRILVNHGTEELVLVDIALLPGYRNRGIGSHVVSALLNEAATAAKCIRLHVLKSSPASRLYERLGFCRVREDGMYCEMLWNPKA